MAGVDICTVQELMWAQVNCYDRALFALEPCASPCGSNETS